jgi:sulfur dioxygenase
MTDTMLQPDLPLIQLFDELSSTYTYIAFDPAGKEAVIIDPVLEQVPRDLGVIAEHGLQLRWCIETHAHADHVTGTGRLAQQLGAGTAAPTHCGIPVAQHQVSDGDAIIFGAQSLKALHTPGHTAGSTCYHWVCDGGNGRIEAVFTGDTLLIDGCGRTDFQGGSAHDLYRSVTQRLFTLPGDTLVLPGHDYKGHQRSTIAHERQHNPRLAGRSEEEFVRIMSALNLPKPRLIDVAVPANRRLGLEEPQGV